MLKNTVQVWTCFDPLKEVRYLEWLQNMHLILPDVLRFSVLYGVEKDDFEAVIKIIGGILYLTLSFVAKIKKNNFN